MIESGSKLTRFQQKFIAALLVETTIVKAAKSAGISEATAFRWLQQPNFQEQYREAKKSLVDQAIGQLRATMGEAVRTLWVVMMDPKSKDSARVSAAKCILEMGLKATELEDLTARVEELERTISAQHTKKGALAANGR